MLQLDNGVISVISMHIIYEIEMKKRTIRIVRPRNEPKLIDKSHSQVNRSPVRWNSSFARAFLAAKFGVWIEWVTAEESWKPNVSFQMV